MQCESIEVYLSGYLDRELPQQRHQQVGLHLGECETCRRLLEELTEIRDKTRQLSFREPSRREWDQMERRIFQNISRGLGWAILIVWSVVTTGYALYQFATSPGEPLFEKILVFGFFLGVALLFLSVLSERLRESRTDRYKGVLK